MEVYLDNSATTKAYECVRDIVGKVMCEDYGNPSSMHKKGVDAEAYVREAKETLAKILKVQEKELYFTSGGTESDHIALLSVLNRQNKGHVLFSSIEHPAIREMANEMKKCGVDTEEIPSDADGIIRPETVVSMLRPDTSLVRPFIKSAQYFFCSENRSSIFLFRAEM